MSKEYCSRNQEFDYEVQGVLQPDKSYRHRQLHDHEVEGSTQLAGENDERHNHRFAVVSGPAIACKGSHYHVIETRTDFTEDHYHFIKARSGLAIHVGNGKHVHFIEDETSVNDGHRHGFEVSMQIESPTENGNGKQNCNYR